MPGPVTTPPVVTTPVLVPGRPASAVGDAASAPKTTIAADALSLSAPKRAPAEATPSPAKISLGTKVVGHGLTFVGFFGGLGGGLQAAGALASIVGPAGLVALPVVAAAGFAAMAYGQQLLHPEDGWLKSFGRGALEAVVGAFALGTMGAILLVLPSLEDVWKQPRVPNR